MAQVTRWMVTRHDEHSHVPAIKAPISIPAAVLSGSVERASFAGLRKRNTLAAASTNVPFYSHPFFARPVGAVGNRQHMGRSRSDIPKSSD